MSEEKAACIDVLLKCTECDNSTSLRNFKSPGCYVSVPLQMKYICTKCGKDMTIVVEKTTHTATTEEVQSSCSDNPYKSF